MGLFRFFRSGGRIAWILIASVLDSVTAGDGDLPAGAAERLARRRIPSITKEDI